MNLITFNASDLNDGCLVLRREVAPHLLGRAAIGGRYRVGMIGGEAGEGVVVDCDTETVSLKVTFAGELRKPSDMTLILALPRPQMLKRVLEFCGCIGAKRVCLVGSDRVERGYFSSTALRQAPESLRLGVEQGMLTRLPELEVHPKLHLFLNRRFEELELAKDARFIADASGSRFTQEIAPESLSLATLAVGPEGGWAEREVKAFQERGFNVINLGEPVLRVETAIYWAVAQLELLTNLGTRANNV